jgi:hypothetical protein
MNLVGFLLWKTPLGLCALKIAQGADGFFLLRAIGIQGIKKAEPQPRLSIH